MAGVARGATYPMVSLNHRVSVSGVLTALMSSG